MTPSPLLQVTGLGMRYPTGPQQPPLTVLDGVDLTMAAGESVAIVGPSGSGKSTLLYLLSGLLQPTAGSVQLGGRELSRLTADELAAVRNRELGFVFQEHHLLPQCTVLENVLVPTLAAACDRAAALRRARELCERVGLGERLAHRPASLSGGERQRVAVVRALIQQPKLLLADEPTGSLDHATAAGIVDLLAGLNRECGVALLVVTHSIALAQRMGRVLELRHGRLGAAGAMA